MPVAFGAESLAAPGAPLVAAGWLGAVAVALGHGLPFGVGAFLARLCAFAVLALAAARAARDPGTGGERASGGERAWAGPIAFGLAAALVPESAGPGGVLASWLPLALLAALPAGRGLRDACAVAALAALAANVSPAGVLAPLVAGVARLGDGVPPRGALRAALVAAAATLLTPAGIALLARAPQILGLDPATMAWSPPFPPLAEPAAYAFGVPLLIAAAALAAWRTRPPAAVALGTALGIVLALADGAFLPFAALVVVPPVARGLARLVPARGAPPFARAVALACAAGLVLGLAVAWSRAAGATRGANAAIPLAAALAARPGTHRAFCDDADGACDALLAEAPRVRTFADGRAAQLPETVRAEALDVRYGKTPWLRTLHAYGIDALVLARDSPVASMAVARGWRRAGAAGAFVLVERP